MSESRGKSDKTPVIGEIEEIEGKPVWIIKAFSNIENVLGAERKHFYSPVFTTPSPISHSPRLQWQFNFYPNFTRGDKHYMSLYLNYKSGFEVTAFVLLSILNDDGNALLDRRVKENKTFRCHESGWGFDRFIGKTYLASQSKSMLKDDTLRISCRLTFVSPTVNDDNDNSRQMDHFKTIFDNGNFSDVTFNVGKHKLKLHKVILTGMSPVFQAMFQHDMKENKESTVDVTDISYDTMRELFRYMYKRHVHNVKKKAADLLVAADKYDVKGLKILCEHALSGNLNLDNAVDNLKLAVMYNAAYLKSKTTDFITNQLKDFVDREDFKLLDSSCTIEIFRAIVQKEAKK